MTRAVPTPPRFAAARQRRKVSVAGIPVPKHLHLLVVEMRGYLEKIEKDYGVAYGLAFDSLRSTTYDRISGGSHSDPTLLTVASRQALKERLEKVAEALGDERDEILRTMNGLHAVLDADGLRRQERDEVEHPKVIGDAEARAIHLARERAERR